MEVKELNDYDGPIDRILLLIQKQRRRYPGSRVIIKYDQNKDGVTFSVVPKLKDRNQKKDSKNGKSEELS